MIFFRTAIRRSARHDEGLFAEEPIPRGSIFGIFGLHAKLTTEAEYQAEQQRSNYEHVQTGVRWIGEYFMYDDNILPEDYINHSSAPNLIYHCGIGIANRDIGKNEELSVDYRFILAQDDVNAFADAETGELISGLPPEEAFRRSAIAVLDLLATGGFAEDAHRLTAALAAYRRHYPVD